MKNTMLDSTNLSTLNAIAEKIIAKIHLKQNNASITRQQSRLQKCFTSGETPTVAALVLSEQRRQTTQNLHSVYVALMDAKKAFDIVWHIYIGPLQRTVQKRTDW